MIHRNCQEVGGMHDDATIKPIVRLDGDPGSSVLDVYRCMKCGRGYKCVGAEHYLRDVVDFVDDDYFTVSMGSK